MDYENLEVIFRFQVAKEFAQRASETTVYYYKTRADIATAAVRAAENAQAIVQKYADRSNYQKLDAYRWEICNRVSYNHDAWADGHPLMDYGNPWQLVWVFDDDSSTNVVCEGYAKAFQYLCDNSHFKGDLTCYRVNGTMFGGNGSGAHMWNIVHMPDGKNYMVDITNCDDGSIGHARQLFLAGCSSAPDPITYVYHCHEGDVSFVYDDWTLRNYSADQLAMSYTTYAPSSTGLGIEWSNFPDDAFRIYIENEIDRDGDGALSDDEIERTTSLSIYDLGISSLKGIEHFTALEDLTCSDNCLTELDVSRNPMLKWLDCSENQLTALDISKNYNLTTLSCDYNQLTALDVTQNTALESLNCRENQLTTLDVSLWKNRPASRTCTEK